MTSAPLPLRLANRPAEPARNVTVEPSEKRNGRSARASATRLGTGAAPETEPTWTLNVGGLRGIHRNSATAAAMATVVAAALTASARRRPRCARRRPVAPAGAANDP